MGFGGIGVGSRVGVDGGVGVAVDAGPGAGAPLPDGGGTDAEVRVGGTGEDAGADMAVGVVGGVYCKPQST